MKRVFLLFLFAGTLAAQQSDVQNLLRLAQAFEQAGEIERASGLYTQLLITDSSNVVYFEGARRSYVQLKKYSEAITLSLRRLMKMPGDISTQISLASVYQMSGDGRRADSVWSAILASNPANQSVYRTVAQGQIELRLFDKRSRRIFSAGK